MKMTMIMMEMMMTTMNDDDEQVFKDTLDNEAKAMESLVDTLMQRGENEWLRTPEATTSPPRCRTTHGPH